MPCNRVCMRNVRAPFVWGCTRSAAARNGGRKGHPEVAQALWELAASHAQQDRTFRTTLSFTRLTAVEAIRQLRAQGFAEDILPSRSGMSEVLSRNGYQPQRVPIASGAQGQTPSRVRRSHRQVHPPAELSALRQQVQPGGTLLGNPGKALERRQADRRPSDAPGGQEHDLDRRSSRRQTEAHRLRKRNHRHQGRHASGRPGCKQTRSCPSAAS